MDLREKFVIDLFSVIHKTDKGQAKFEEMGQEDQQRSRDLAEGMLKKGWYVDPEKGIK